MQLSNEGVEIFLQPGDFYFGGRGTRVRTLLGSCVAIVMWHPLRLIGGMCHLMLPRRTRPTGAPPDGRYADEAMELFLDEIRAAATRPWEYQVKLFGGGNMFPNRLHGDAIHIGLKNAEAARALVKAHGCSVLVEDLGGVGHRSLIFDVATGHVWAKTSTSNLPGLA